MNRTIVLIDGENILFRFQEMLESGKVVNSDVTHIEDRVLWNPNMLTSCYDILRISYYTTVVGDNDAVTTLSNEIAALPFTCKMNATIATNGTLNPHVFKKDKKKSKNKSVDVNIAIDALRHAYNKNVDQIYLISGDGDFIPLVKEIMHHGIQVTVAAFSNGCNDELRYIADDFHCLDNLYFDK